MNTIWKYPLALTRSHYILVPQGSAPLSAQLQNDTIALWMLVDTDKPLVQREVLIYGTGHTIEQEHLEYVDSVQTEGGAFVWHVFMDTTNHSYPIIEFDELLCDAIKGK